jgi:hypothetical protein
MQEHSAIALIFIAVGNVFYASFRPGFWRKAVNRAEKQAELLEIVWNNSAIVSQNWALLLPAQGKA